MLHEIICDAFKSYGQPRGAITFKRGLNIVKGQDSGENSIGKSTFLLAIDFVFGGSTYSDDKIMLKKIKNHTIKFCFIFNDKPYYFSRSTDKPKFVNICNEKYEILETVSTEKYCEQLMKLYNIDLFDISFRQVVGRYFRIYGRDSSNEKQPLASYLGESQADSLLSFIKLFNCYQQIAHLHDDIEEKKKYKTAIVNANKYNLVKVISKKKEYDENLLKVEALQQELVNITNYGREDILSLDPQQAETAASYKAKYDNLNKQKKQLWAKYYTIKNNMEIKRPTTEDNFNELLRFFPNCNIKLISDIENFHTKLSDILNEEFKNAISETLYKINQISSEMADLDDLLKEYDLPQRVAEKTLKSYASIQNQLNDINKTNELYLKKKEIESEIKSLQNGYEKLFLEQFDKICKLLNGFMQELNSYIYGNDVVAPILKVNKSNSYTFGTEVDDGTGTNNKNLILLDLASLRESELPVISHDTILFKHIGQEPMAKILELYNKSDKQIFIAIDESTKYSNSAQNIIENQTILQLSAGGNELFGSSWVKKITEDETME